jgi:hypothetical protein
MDRNELVLAEEIVFPKVPYVEAPRIIEVHPRFDWGQRFREGIIDHPLPGIGELYPILVPTVGSDGNEIGGIKTPHVRVPVATYTGWNYPSDSFQGVDRTRATRLSGAWLPFSASSAERRKHGDDRMSLGERYGNLEEYLSQLTEAAEDLISQRLMFSEDLELVLKQGEAMYTYVAEKWKFREFN